MLQWDSHRAGLRCMDCAEAEGYCTKSKIEDVPTTLFMDVGWHSRIGLCPRRRAFFSMNVYVCLCANYVLC